MDESAGAEFGDILQPPTDDQNYSGKAYTIRDGESLVSWLQRGSREDGAEREKFRKTIFGNVRMMMKLRAVGGPQNILETPEPGPLSLARELVLSRAIELTKEAKLDDWAAELIVGTVETAYSTMLYGPIKRELEIRRLLFLIVQGLSWPDASSEATQWLRNQMNSAKADPRNLHGDDDEAIAADILKTDRPEEPRQPTA